MSSCAIPLFNSLQGSNNPSDTPRPVLEGWDYTKSLSRHSIAELYLDGRVSVALELTSKRNLDSSRAEASQSESAGLNLPVFVFQFHVINEHEIQDHDKQAVFIVNIEPVNGPQVGVPSFVRFHAIDHEAKQAASVGYFSFFGENRFKCLPFGPERKIEELGLEGGRVQSCVGFSPCDIKSALEIVDCVSNHQCEVSADFPVTNSVIEKLLPRLRVDVQSQMVSISRSKDSLLNISDVLIGPFDFQDRITVRSFPDFAHG